MRLFVVRTAQPSSPHIQWRGDEWGGELPRNEPPSVVLKRNLQMMMLFDNLQGNTLEAVFELDSMMILDEYTILVIPVGSFHLCADDEV